MAGLSAVVEAIFAGLGRGGASRQVVAAAAAAVVRSSSEDLKEQGHRTDLVSHLVRDRLSVLEPPLRAQVEHAPANGRNAHSPAGLLHHDQVLRANVAKHSAFDSTKLVSEMSVKELRRCQRGRRVARVDGPHEASSCSDAASGTTRIADDFVAIDLCGDLQDTSSQTDVSGDLVMHTAIACASSPDPPPPPHELEVGKRILFKSGASGKLRIDSHGVFRVPPVPVEVIDIQPGWVQVRLPDSSSALSELFVREAVPYDVV